MGDEYSSQLPFHGNKLTMNMNNLLLQNIQQASTYFKHELYKLNTLDSVIDEIYYKVTHLEPWEKGSRTKDTSSLMNAGVRGISSGGIASTGFCILYKIYTMNISKSDLTKMLFHEDSAFIKCIGLLLIRYTFPAKQFGEYLEDILDDDTEISSVESRKLKPMEVSELVRKLFSSELKWYDTILPRIPVMVLKDLERVFKENEEADGKYGGGWGGSGGSDDDGADFWGSAVVKNDTKSGKKVDRVKNGVKNGRNSKADTRSSKIDSNNSQIEGKPTYSADKYNKNDKYASVGRRNYDRYENSENRKRSRSRSPIRRYR